VASLAFGCGGSSAGRIDGLDVVQQHGVMVPLTGRCRSNQWLVASFSQQPVTPTERTLGILSELRNWDRPLRLSVWAVSFLSWMRTVADHDAVAVPCRSWPLRRHTTAPHDLLMWNHTTAATFGRVIGD
jgi:hypothetical protein